MKAFLLSTVIISFILLSTNLALADTDFFVGSHSADMSIRPAEPNPNPYFEGGDFDLGRVNAYINLADKVDLNWGRFFIFWKTTYFLPQGLGCNQEDWGDVIIGLDYIFSTRITPFAAKMNSRFDKGGIIICLVPSAPYSPHADNLYFNYYRIPNENYYSTYKYGTQIADVGDRLIFWDRDNDTRKIWAEETRLNFEPHWVPKDNALAMDGPDIPNKYTWEYFCKQVAIQIHTLKESYPNIKVYVEIMNEPFNRTWVSMGYKDEEENNLRITANETKIANILRYAVLGLKKGFWAGQTNEYYDTRYISDLPIEYIIFGHLNDKRPDYNWNEETKLEEQDAGNGWNIAVIDTLRRLAHEEGKELTKIYCNAFAFHPYHFHSPDSTWSWNSWKDTFQDKILYIKSNVRGSYSTGEWARWPITTPLFITECGWHGTIRADVEDYINNGTDPISEWGKFLKDKTVGSDHPYTSSMENVWIGSEYKKGWMEYIYGVQKNSDKAYYSARYNHFNYYSWQVNFRDNREGKTQEQMDKQEEFKYKNEGHSTSENVDEGENQKPSYTYTELLKGWFGNSNWVKVNYVNPKMFSNPKLNEVNVANYLIRCLQICRDANTINPQYPIRGFIYWHFADYRNEWDDHWRHMGIFHVGCSHNNSSGSSRIDLFNNVGPARLAAFAVKRYQKTVIPSFSRKNYAKVNNYTLAVKNNSILNRCISNISSKINNSEIIGTYSTGKWRSGRCMSTGSVQQRACIQLPSNWQYITINNGKHAVSNLSQNTILDYIPWKCPHKLYFYWGTTGNENEVLPDHFEELVSTSSSSPNSITINRTLQSKSYIWIIGQSDYPYDFIWGNYAVDGSIPQGKNITAKMLPPYMHISPNPFYGKLKMEYFVSNQNQKQNLVSITLYDISGKRISEIINKQCKSGKHSIEYQMDKFKPGVYFCRYIIDGKVISTQKILHLAESAKKE